MAFHEKHYQFPHKKGFREKIRGGAGFSERMEKALRQLEKALEDYVEEDNGDEPPPMSATPARKKTNAPNLQQAGRYPSATSGCFSPPPASTMRLTHTKKT